MLMGSVSMGLMNVVAKLIREWTKVTALQTSLFRAFGMTYFSYLYCKYHKIDHLNLPSSIAPTFFIRCVYGYISVTTMFLGVFLLPFSLANVLIFTQPVFAAVVGFLFGNERLTYFEVVSIIFAMFGVVIMTNPELIDFWTESETVLDLDKYP